MFNIIIARVSSWEEESCNTYCMDMINEEYMDPHYQNFDSKLNVPSCIMIFRREFKVYI